MDWRVFYPWLGVAPQKFCASLSTLFFLGALKAPGTWGSAAGSLFVAFLLSRLNPAFYVLFALFLIYFSIGICEIGERVFKLKDPGKINFDEFAAMPVCYLSVYLSGALWHHFWVWILAGFIVFRFFDIAKPFGIRRVQILSGGLGCVIDDVLAGVFTTLVLYFASLFYC